MKNFLKIVFATIVGLALWSGFFFGFFFMILAASGGDKEVVVKENSILHLKLDKQLVEKSGEDSPFGNLDLPFGSGGGKVGLIEFKSALEQAKVDENIKGIYLDVSSSAGGFASLEVVRKALVDFKTSGKFIVAYAETMSEGAYYLASTADEIYLYPQGMLEFNGLSTQIMYYTGLFEKLGVKAEIFKVGKFKSAVEPFFRKDMSDPNREQVTSFLNSMYDHYLRQVAESRGKTYAEYKAISDSMLVRDAKDAVKYGLITRTAYYDEVVDILKEKSERAKKDELNLITLSKYKKSFVSESNWDSKNKVAIIVASGQITSGKSTSENMGSETVAAAIREARLDEDVKAIVLRVNSPGGSALASDVMWREVMLTKEVKPIVASMSDVAASGGYYISMACDKIVAEPNTITGSIGVFGLMFNTEGLMKDKLGITFDGVKTGQFSDLPNMNREMTEFEKAVIQDGVNKIYEDFTQKAADGRGMDVEKLREIASGRVWSGLEAKENGLVDELGGIERALEIASSKAELEDYDVVYYPKEKGFMEKIFEDMDMETKLWVGNQQFGELAPLVKEIKNLENFKGVQARLPFQIEVIR